MRATGPDISPGLDLESRDITDGLEVAGDEELLRRAIDNILSNVAAHPPEGSTATLTAIGRDGQVILDVSDDGPASPPGAAAAHLRPVLPGQRAVPPARLRPGMFPAYRGRRRHRARRPGNRRPPPSRTA